MNSETQAAVEYLVGSKMTQNSSLSGGCISDTFHCSLESGEELFVKCQPEAPQRFFALEAEGLAWLAEAEALAVPRVVGYGPQFLALEYLAPAPHTDDFDVKFGRGLARLHKFGAPSFGWHSDNYLATLHQSNPSEKHWPTFYSESRLRPLLKQCIDSGLAPQSWTLRFESLFTRMPQFAGAQEPPSRLHGDLWSGNVHCAKGGVPVLIDPAVYGGNREIDLAMLELFGSPSAAFYAAYDEVHPRCEGHAQRVSLYQLYPLLAHIVLFGTSYVEPCERALAPWC